jgi:hypothetical protein
VTLVDLSPRDPVAQARLADPDVLGNLRDRVETVAVGVDGPGQFDRLRRNSGGWGRGTRTPFQRCYHLSAGVRGKWGNSSCRPDEGHENFWKLVQFLQTFRDVVLPSHEFRVTPAEDAQLIDAFRGHDKAEVLSAVRAYLGSDLSEADVQMLVDRRKTLKTFERLLKDQDFVETERL